ncbi:hypothetical protein PRIC1_010305 [Phytophthora ramorum]
MGHVSGRSLHPLRGGEEEPGERHLQAYTVEQQGHRFPVQDPEPVVAPPTLLTLDSRLLLGWQPGASLPAQFPDLFVVDLYEVLGYARQDFPQA